METAKAGQWPWKAHPQGWACRLYNAIFMAGNGSKRKPLRWETWEILSNGRKRGGKKDNRRVMADVGSRDAGREHQGPRFREWLVLPSQRRGETHVSARLRRRPVRSNRPACYQAPNATSTVSAKASEPYTVFTGTLSQISTWHTSICVVSSLTQMLRSCVWAVLLVEFWQNL